MRYLLGDSNRLVEVRLAVDSNRLGLVAGSSWSERKELNERLISPLASIKASASPLRPVDPGAQPRRS